MELRERIDFDFILFADDWRNQTAIAGRTALINAAVQSFLERHPNTIVVNLGTSFDCRFQRLDNGLAEWYELDLAEVMALR